jgi:ribosomal protein S18 acetylase RimI-like enzyme
MITLASADKPRRSHNLSNSYAASIASCPWLQAPSERYPRWALDRKPHVKNPLAVGCAAYFCVPPWAHPHPSVSRGEAVGGVASPSGSARREAAGEGCEKPSRPRFSVWVFFKNMGELTDRAYAGVADLRRIEELLARGYASTSLRVGDISWMSRDHTHRELALDIRVWEAVSNPTNLVAFAYFRSNGEFNVFVAPDSRHSNDAPLCDELLGFIDSAWRTSAAAGDPPVELTTYAIDPSRSIVDSSLAAALERAGFKCDDSGSAGALVRSLDDLEEPLLPAGYHFDWVRTPELMAGRVEAHRAAFAPSDLSIKRYARVQQTWAYRTELDRLLVSDSDEVVAFCTAWLDEHNAAGLLEPVGTHPAHQRLGLARAVCLDACRELRKLGATRAQVGYSTAPALATYTSAGFSAEAHEVTYSKALPGNR